MIILTWLINGLIAFMAFITLVFGYILIINLLVDFINGIRDWVKWKDYRQFFASLKDWKDLAGFIAFVIFLIGVGALVEKLVGK